MIKHSKQRDAIIEYISGRTDHPSAEMIYSAIHEKYPNISLGTIYRNLGLLTSTGQLMRIPMQSGSDRFDPNTHEHYHFYCRHCSSVMDISMTHLDSLNSLAQAHFGGTIEGHSLLFYGICDNCQKNIK